MKSYISLSKYFRSPGNGGTLEMAVIPKWLMVYFCEIAYIKAENRHFDHILIVLFQVHSGDV